MRSRPDRIPVSSSVSLLVLAILLGSPAGAAEAPDGASADGSAVTPRAEIRESIDVHEHPEAIGEARIPADELDAPGRVDLAAALREIPGLGAIRRGPINLEPTVRGLQEQQITMLVDGTKTTAAGPGRMDSDLSHVALRDVEEVRVTRGPSALTRGPGSLATVELVTRRPRTLDTVHWGGEVRAGGATNGDVREAAASLRREGPRFGMLLSAGTRAGDDVEAGDGSTVPADYESTEARWRLRLLATEHLSFDWSGGHQRQDDIDYRGRLLDAIFFQADTHSLGVSFDRPDETVSRLFGQVWISEKSHAMTNDAKPSAQPMPGRIPPFGVDVELPTSSDTLGGRLAADAALGEWRLRIGSDATRVDQTATRRISRRDTGMLLFEDRLWPDVSIEDMGLWAETTRSFSDLEIRGAVRGDRVDTRARDLSAFFLTHADADSPDGDETHFAAAVSARWSPAERWIATAGLGRAQRGASASERWADRTPSTRVQVSGEFLGDPDLEPETSVQLDTGILYAGPRVRVSLDAFWREIDDPITIEAAPELPTRLPMTSPPVYRFVNGDPAEAFGGELFVRAEIAERWSGTVTAAWTRAEDTVSGEPLLGIAPLRVRAAVDGRSPGGRFAWEVGVTRSEEQDRVATSRGEIPTPGWTTWDARLRSRLGRGFDLEVGVDNLADEAYAEHLNARNPFSGQRILEPGRSVAVRLAWRP